jgi:hypothetical protein
MLRVERREAEGSVSCRKAACEAEGTYLARKGSTYEAKSTMWHAEKQRSRGRTATLRNE